MDEHSCSSIIFISIKEVAVMAIKHIAVDIVDEHFKEKYACSTVSDQTLVDILNERDYDGLLLMLKTSIHLFRNTPISSQSQKYLDHAPTEVLYQLVRLHGDNHPVSWQLVDQLFQKTADMFTLIQGDLIEPTKYSHK